MRTFAWCLIGVLIACGQSKSDPANTPEGTGGVQTSGSGGTGDVEGGAGGDDDGTSSGGATTGDGGVNAEGGAGERAGASGGPGGTANAGSVARGGNSATSGGSDPAGGQAENTGGNTPVIGGSAGAAGSSGDECGQYVACGCGCCTEETTYGACYYPELGDRLDAIIADDKARAMDPECEAAGCALATRRVCCVSPSDPGAATYTAESTSDAGEERVDILREEPDGACTILSFSFPTEEATPFPLEFPDGWALFGAMDGFDCDERFNLPSVRVPRGGVGFVRFTDGDRCRIDFDYTLFFIQEDGTVEATRSVAERVRVARRNGCG